MTDLRHLARFRLRFANASPSDTTDVGGADASILTLKVPRGRPAEVMYLLRCANAAAEQVVQLPCPSGAGAQAAVDAWLADQLERVFVIWLAATPTGPGHRPAFLPAIRIWSAAQVSISL